MWDKSFRLVILCTLLFTSVTAILEGDALTEMQNIHSRTTTYLIAIAQKSGVWKSNRDGAAEEIEDAAKLANDNNEKEEGQKLDDLAKEVKAVDEEKDYKTAVNKGSDATKIMRMLMGETVGQGGEGGKKKKHRKGNNKG